MVDPSLRGAAPSHEVRLDRANWLERVPDDLTSRRWYRREMLVRREPARDTT